jgi:26S proteasome regulatory subunit N1
MLVPFVFTCFLDIFFKLQALLSTILTDSQTPLEVLVLTAISLGLVFVGVCNEEIVVQSIIFVLMDHSEADDAEPIIRMLPVALGLLYLGKQVCFFPW